MHSYFPQLLHRIIHIPTNTSSAFDTIFRLSNTLSIILPPLSNKEDLVYQGHPNGENTKRII